MKNTRVRYSARSRYGSEREGTVKNAVFKQTIICAAVLFAIFLLKDTFFEKNGFPYKAAGVILTQNTDFKEKWEDLKSFFAEQIKVTSLITGEKDLDPVRNMISPAKGTVYQGFGLEAAKDGTESFCYGVKLKTKDGEKVMSVQNGTVSETGEHSLWGRYILIKHSEKIYSFYAHLGEILPKAGEEIKTGQVIAKTEVNPKEGFNMIYFEIRDGESTLDPEAFIDFGTQGEDIS